MATARAMPSSTLGAPRRPAASAQAEQRHIGTLPQLRASRMPSIADMDHCWFGRTWQRPVCIMRKGELVRIANLIEQRCGQRPQVADLGLPCVEPRASPVVKPVCAQRPEEGRLCLCATRWRSDREHPGHCAGAAVALFERRLVKPGILEPVEVGPERAISERFSGRWRKRRPRAQCIDDKIERLRLLAILESQVAA